MRLTHELLMDFFHEGHMHQPCIVFMVKADNFGKNFRLKGENSIGGAIGLQLHAHTLAQLVHNDQRNILIVFYNLVIGFFCSLRKMATQLLCIKF